MPTNFKSKSFKTTKPTSKSERNLHHGATDGPASLGTWALDAKGSTRIEITGSNIWGRTKTKVEDASQVTTTKQGSGTSTLEFTLQGCKCPEWSGAATIGVRHHIIFSGSLGAGTFSTTKLVMTADAMGTTTSLIGEGETTSVENGSLEHSEGSKGKLELDLKGKGKGKIKGTDVDGDANVKISHESDSSTTRKQKILKTTGGSIGGFVTKEFEKEVSVQCGSNSYDANSSMSLSLQSKAIGDDTPWLRSRIEASISNELTLKALKVKECPKDGKQTERQLIIPSTAFSFPDAGHLWRAYIQYGESCISGLPKNVRMDDEIISIDFMNLVKPLNIIVTSSDPDVLKVQTKATVQPGTESIVVKAVPQKAGTAKVTLKIEDEDFEEEVEIKVIDFKSMEAGLYNFPEEITLKHGELRQLTFTALSESQEGAAPTLKVGDEELLTAKLVKGGDAPLENVIVALSAIRPGKTTLQVLHGNIKREISVVVDDHDLPVVCLPESVDLLEGLLEVLPIRLPFAYPKDISFDVSFEKDNICTSAGKTITIAAGERIGYIRMFPLSRGRTVLRLKSEQHGIHNVMLEVEAKESEEIGQD